jgi:hypothetical protein
MDTKLAKWLRWLEKVIQPEVQQLVAYKDIFWSVQGLIQKNKNIQKPSRFYTFLGDTYASYSLIGIRRQVKVDKQSISFCCLLEELAEHPEILSREYFTGLYQGSALEQFGQADKDFDKFCGTTPKHISRKMVVQDIDTLKSQANKCEDFSDKRIAHRDKRDPKSPLTFGEIDNCIDFIDKLYCKYHLIFTAECADSLKPAVL